jgi:hypothetical protein
LKAQALVVSGKCLLQPPVERLFGAGREKPGGTMKRQRRRWTLPRTVETSRVLRERVRLILPHQISVRHDCLQLRVCFVLCGNAKLPRLHGRMHLDLDSFAQHSLRRALACALARLHHALHFG